MTSAAKGSSFERFTHPERSHYLEFCQFTNDHLASEAPYFQGLKFESQGNLDSAIAAYRKAIELDSQFSAYYQALGNMLARSGQADKAIAYSQQASGLYGWHLCGERDYQFIDNWFSENIPIWQEYLSPFAKRADVQALEIGSYQGMSTCWLLDNILNHPSAKIVCVDLFRSPWHEQFDSNVLKTSAQAKVTKIANRSQEALLFLRPRTYDFIYIDGFHEANAVLQDAVLSWNLVNVGGLMIFDDYGEPGEQSAKQGTDWFLSLFNTSVEILHKGYQVILRKTSNTVDLDALSDFQNVLSKAILKSLMV